MGIFKQLKKDPPKVKRPHMHRLRKFLRKQFLLLCLKHTARNLHAEVPRSRSFYKRWEKVQNIFACSGRVKTAYDILKKANPTLKELKRKRKRK